MSKENIDLIKTIYDKFAARDFDNLLTNFVDDFEWISAENSPLADRSPYHGIDEIREGVFERIAAAFESLTTEADEIFVADGSVDELVHYRGRCRGRET